jgi:predicted nucleic acid-binding protein
MTEVFADTAFFVGLLNERDELHPQEKGLVKEYVGRTLTTYWVLLELANYCASTPYRETAGAFIATWLGDAAEECVSPSGAAFLEGLRLYRDRPDKEWSLTDCISFSLMRERRIVEALTSDHHFEQAGFQILLK